MHCRHVMWLHPWFFSMRVLHFGHCFVFARIQFAVSLSFWHFSFHIESSVQDAGSCASSPHLQSTPNGHIRSSQNSSAPHEHWPHASLICTSFRAQDRPRSHAPSDDAMPVLLEYQNINFVTSGTSQSHPGLSTRTVESTCCRTGDT